MCLYNIYIPSWNKESTSFHYSTYSCSSKTAPRIFIFSIVLGAEYSSYLKSIATYAPAFLGYNNSVLARVTYISTLQEFHGILFTINAFDKTFQVATSGLLRNPAWFLGIIRFGFKDNLQLRNNIENRWKFKDFVVLS